MSPKSLLATVLCWVLGLLSQNGILYFLMQVNIKVHLSHTSPKGPKYYLFLDMENRLVTAKREGVMGEMEWEAGVSRCNLIWRTDKQ